MGFESVWEALQNTKRPLTSREVRLLCEKSRGSVYKELKDLMKRNMIKRLEIQYDPKKKEVIVLYESN